MRRVILLVMLAFVLGMTNAQSQSLVKYHGEVDAGYSLGVGGLTAVDRIVLHTVQGVSIGKYFSTGIGFGADYYYSPEVGGEYEDFETEDEGTIMIPVYLNLKGYLPVSNKVSPYISLDAGVGIGVTDDVSGAMGVYATPAIGVRYGILKAQVGYNVQRMTDEDWTYGLGAIQFKVGVMF